MDAVTRPKETRMITKRLLSALVVALLGSHALFGQMSPVTGRLVIPDQRVLPGVPFDMWVELRNPSDASVTVGLYPTLLAHITGGADFQITPAPDDAPALLSQPNTLLAPLQFVTMRPHGTQTLTLPVAFGLVPGPFFRDYRLSPPGEYHLSLRLDRYPDGTSGGVPLTFLGPVVTSEAVVQRVTPVGVDEKVWRRMQEVAGGHWTPPSLTSTTASPEDLDAAARRFAVWSEVVTQYRDSAYFPYAVAAHQGIDDAYHKLALDAVTRFPSSPVADVLHVAIVQLTRAASTSNPRHTAYQ